MRSEATGLEITTDRPATTHAVEAFERALLSHDRGVKAVVAAADADPDCALVNALAAAILLVDATSEACARAGPYLTALAAAAPRASPRERLIARAVIAQATGQPETAVAAFFEIAHRWPHDLASTKLCQLLQAETLDPADRLRLVHLVLPANGDKPAAYGMLAFALVQARDLDGAEAAARQALCMSLDDPWAHHALIHVLAARRMVEDALAWLRGHAETWANRSFGLTAHMWWHAAVCSLDLGKGEQALDIYDDRIAPNCGAHLSTQCDAALLLARLELKGCDVADRWRALAPALDPRFEEVASGRRDLHISYGLARLRRDRRLLAQHEDPPIDGSEAGPLARSG